MKRHSFILAETVIAGVITALTIAACCAALTMFWRMTVKEEKTLEKTQRLHRRSTYVRHVLSQIVRGKEDPFVLDPPTGNMSERLLFVFDNGCHINPALHGLVLAMLYVDKQQGLVLVTRSHPARKNIDQEEECASVIWPGIKKISWKFALCRKDKAEKSGINDADWQTIWPKEWSGLPAIVQVTLADSDGNDLSITSVVMSNLDYIQAS